MSDSTDQLLQAQRDEQFRHAMELFRAHRLFDLIDEEFPRRENAVFTNGVVILLLLYQRMCPDKSLAAALKLVLEVTPELLPNNKRVTQKTLSSDPSGYSKARQKCDLKAIQKFAQQVAQVIIDTTQPRLQNRRTYVIDGTTVSLAPEPALRKVYPPASNQHGETAHPTAMLVMAFELEMGAAVLPAIGAMYGEQAVSETALVEEILPSLPSHSVVMGDSGFGIFYVAWQTTRSTHDFVFRLTLLRYKALLKRARLVSEKDGVTTHELLWRPTAKDRKSHSQLPADAALPVRLHAIQLSDTQTLYLVTNLTTSGAELSDLYQHRYDVELDIRNFKVTLNAELSRVKSVSMFQKELWMSLVAYNLVCQFRRLAAEQAQMPPRRLSFKGVLTTFTIFLLNKSFASSSDWPRAFERALTYAMKDKLPNRPNRHFEREAYHRCPKSSQFKKRPVKKDGQP